MYINAELIWKIVYITLFVINIIFNIIVFISLHKKSSGSVTSALKDGKEFIGNLLKSFGITSITDFTNTVNEIKDLFKKDHT